MPIITDLQGNAISWEEIKRRNAEYWLTHDRYGRVIPGMTMVDKALKMARTYRPPVPDAPVTRYKPPSAAEAKRRTDERAAQIIAERRAAMS